MGELMEKLRRRLPGATPAVSSSFAALDLQQRLSRLAAEINALDAVDRREFGRGHHARAARLAYAQTLDDACQLIGMPVEDSGPTHQLIAEARLMHAGWRW